MGFGSDSARPRVAALDLRRERFATPVLLSAEYGFDRTTFLNVNELTTLEEVCLDHWSDLGVTDEHLAQLAGLDHLKRLDLSGSQITDDGLRHLAQLTNLERLDLNRTQISGEGLSHLFTVQKTDKAVLDFDAVTAAGIKSLSGTSMPWKCCM